jgi:hypothetical protein
MFAWCTQVYDLTVQLWKWQINWCTNGYKCRNCRHIFIVLMRNIEHWKTLTATFLLVHSAKIRIYDMKTQCPFFWRNVFIVFKQLLWKLFLVFCHFCSLSLKCNLKWKISNEIIITIFFKCRALKNLNGYIFTCSFC